MLSRRIDLPLGENALASLAVLTGIHTVTHERTDRPKDGRQYNSGFIYV